MYNSIFKIMLAFVVIILGSKILILSFLFEYTYRMLYAYSNLLYVHLKYSESNISINPFVPIG